MIKVGKDEFDIEGNLMTILNDYVCVISGVYNILTKSYEMDKEAAKDIMNKAFKLAIKHKKLKSYEEMHEDE